MEQQRQTDELRQIQRMAADPAANEPTLLSMIPEPQTVEELGISPAIVNDLILRIIRQEGEVSVRKMRVISGVPAIPIG